jgi:hypothetical protein
MIQVYLKSVIYYNTANQKDCVYVNIHIPSEALIYLEDESLEF